MFEDAYIQIPLPSTLEFSFSKKESHDKMTFLFCFPISQHDLSSQLKKRNNHLHFFKVIAPGLYFLFSLLSLSLSLSLYIYIYIYLLLE